MKSDFQHWVSDLNDLRIPVSSQEIGFTSSKKLCLPQETHDFDDSGFPFNNQT